ncbi:MAG: hypothetical protein FWD46_08755 [Cystobacterineae bacterium]|nr:hypothetical protein [Cystobacterineae bacterium]
MERQDKETNKSDNRKLRDVIRFLDCISGMLAFTQYALTYLQSVDDEHRKLKTVIEKLNEIYETLETLKRRFRCAAKELGFENIGHRHSMLVSTLNRLLKQMPPIE